MPPVGHPNAQSAPWLAEDLLPEALLDGQPGVWRGSGGAPGVWIGKSESMSLPDIEAQRERLAELSTPIIPITDDVVVMPLIGTMDESRVGELMRVALRGAMERPVRAVILDVTGVKNGDTRVADALVQTASALRLLGAQAILTGVRADVARSLMESGTELTGIVTKSSLQAGVTFALGKALRGR